MYDCSARRAVSAVLSVVHAVPLRPRQPKRADQIPFLSQSDMLVARPQSRYCRKLYASRWEGIYRGGRLLMQ
ncbi:hypothetical protein DACRYDRAFT_19446 [Dacryopinax primogenitus]|uniref:Uncharacterized protein n=1 Tax=Dacryopinax primogenitus (strain DJM 731) TaxID=1858805 RepID=M5GFD0_DACPD|nr:uncharacterized protein DACRYDRAFT_19446 [Dacryopinax primogenitus]EJU06162.1 hypothetical protein DACRYDRAFT_19446 [Dacryopinax primogenitus]